MSFFSPSRCVLILGDEGLQVFNVARLGAKFAGFLPWDTADFEKAARDLIVKKCRRKPVVIFNDMVEQHYRKERIPKVSFLDRQNVIKRRLSVAFPNYKVRAALKLKDKSLGIAEERKGDPYLFAAIPQSTPFTKTVDAVRLSKAPIVGFYLLPVEAAAMVRVLSAKLTKGRRHKSIWTIFVGQHHGGGLRQIVTRNGELALTRMSPIVDTDVEPELWAKEVAGELGATMSYLTRFGYKEIDGLDIIVVANDSSRDSLEEFINIECNLTVMTSQQVAGLLGAYLGRQEDLRYADPLYASYIGKKTKFTLPMEAPAIRRLTQPRRIVSFVLLGLLLACSYFGLMTFHSWKTYIGLKDKLVVAVQQNSSLKEEYLRELEKKKALGFDFLYVNNSIEIYNELEKQKLKPLPVIREIGRSLGPDIRLDKLEIDIEKNEKDQDGNIKEEKEITYLLNAVMTISFPNTIDPDTGVEKINNIKERLQSNLPDYEVEVIKQVADLSYTGNFVGQAGDSTSKDDDVPERYDAEIRVRGWWK